MTLVADAAAPLVLADGTKIDPTSGKVIKDRKARQFVEVPAGIEAQELVAKTKRSINELPVPTKQMSGLGLVLFYSMWGLADQEIAISLGMTLEQVKNVKKLPEYRQISEDIKKTVLEHEANDVRNFFQQRAMNAAQKVVEIAEEEDGILGLKASQDILDRAGFRPADIVEHKHTMEGGLRIEVIERKERKDIPEIEGQFEVIEDGNR
jgi:hypothetical protein